MKNEIANNAYILIYIKKNKIDDLFNKNEEEKTKNIFQSYSKTKKEKERKLKADDNNAKLTNLFINQNHLNKPKRRENDYKKNLPYQYIGKENHEHNKDNKNKKEKINMQETMDFNECLNSLNAYTPIVNKSINKLSSKRKTIDYYIIPRQNSLSFGQSDMKRQNGRMLSIRSSLLSLHK